MGTYPQSGRFLDKRLGKRGAKLLQFICGKARIVMQKADKWSEQVSFYRFFNNERVTEEALTGCMEDHCLEQLGPAGNGRGCPGFLW